MLASLSLEALISESLPLEKFKLRAVDDEHFEIWDVIRKKYIILTLTIMSGLSACTKAPPSAQKIETQLEIEKLDPTPNHQKTLNNLDIKPAYKAFINTVDKQLSTLLDKALTLHKQVITFTKNPTPEGLSVAISTLNSTHNSYTSSDVLRLCCLTESEDIEPSTEHYLSLHSKLDHTFLILLFESGLRTSDLMYFLHNFKEEDVEVRDDIVIAPDFLVDVFAQARLVVS